MARTVHIAADHAGLALKNALVAYLQERADAFAVTVVDHGPHDGVSVDYPDFAERVARAVAAGASANAEAARNGALPPVMGLLVCGSGIGMSIAANKVPGVRAAWVGDPLMARLCREHNDANVACFGERLQGRDLVMACVETFLSTPFAGGRHQRRIDKMIALDAARSGGSHEPTEGGCSAQPSGV